MDGKRIALVALLTALLVAGVGGGAFWWWQGRAAAPAHEAPKPARYVSLDKVIVMLKGQPGAEPHYLAVDLVFRSDEEGEARVKAQLPYLKSLAVRTLSRLTLEQAQSMSVDDYHRLLARSYAAVDGERAFAEVMLSKLIVE